MYNHKYIKKEGLDNLKEYKYACLDRSVLAQYVMQPFWNYAINFLPTWMAPNLITLIGFGAILVSYLLTAYYSPHFSEPFPMWIYPLNAICLFFYQLMDALDGKQARRTKSSSPLGELFDHGCDAMTTVFLALSVSATLRIGSGFLVYFNVIFMMLTFFHSQWEVYFTGMLDLWYINVTEAQFLSMALYMVPFFFGSDFFALSSTFAGITLTRGEWVLIPTAISTIAFFSVSVFHMGRLSKTKDRAFLKRVILYTIPPWWTVFFWTLWYFVSPQLMVQHGHAFCIAPGFVLCNFVGRIVTARVCKLDYDIVYLTMIPLPFLVLNAYLGIVNEVAVLYAYCAFAVLAYLHFGLCLIKEMTEHLKIHALSIPEVPKTD